MPGDQFAQALEAVVNRRFREGYKKTRAVLSTLHSKAHRKLITLTNIDESARCSFAKLLGFVGKGHFDHTGNVPGRRLHADGM